MDVLGNCHKNKVLKRNNLLTECSLWQLLRCAVSPPYLFGHVRLLARSHRRRSKARAPVGAREGKLVSQPPVRYCLTKQPKLLAWLPERTLENGPDALFVLHC